MKHILITNDDGITASGIVRLAEAARAFGDVTVVAPEAECSALSHSITIQRPMSLSPHDFPVPGVTAWACGGTPSDCVRVALAWLLPEEPDLVLSGINNGWNIATDIQYSATVGAALEAAHQGIPAIAFSEPYNGDRTAADRFLPRILASLLDQRPGRDAILNVNFPSAPCGGILTGRTVSAGSMFRTRFRLLVKSPDGAVTLTGDSVPDETCEEGSDFRAILDHYISVGIVRNVG